MGDKITLVSFASPTHEKTQEGLLKYRNYFDGIVLYRDSDIEEEFRVKYAHMFKYPKYNGYFIWKPYVLLDAFENADTDNILYVDSNFRFLDIEKFLRIYNDYKDDFFIPKYNHYFNKHWTKRDCFYYMGCDEEKYWNANQVWSVVMGFNRRSSRIRGFLNDFLIYLSDERISTDNPNVCGRENLPGFIAHRWDQSILSLMVEDYGIEGCLYNSLLEVVDKIYPAEILAEKASHK